MLKTIKKARTTILAVVLASPLLLQVCTAPAMADDGQRYANSVMYKALTCAKAVLDVAPDAPDIVKDKLWCQCMVHAGASL